MMLRCVTRSFSFPPHFDFCPLQFAFSPLSPVPCSLEPFPSMTPLTRSRIKLVLFLLVPATVLVVMSVAFPQKKVPRQPEPSKEFRFVEDRALQGEARGQAILGEMYRTGRGVKPDAVEAFKWFSLAAAGGSKDAEVSQSRLAGHMTAEQLAEAKRRAAAFVPHPPKPPPEQ